MATKLDRLRELPKEELVDALLMLAEEHPRVRKFLERLVAKPTERMKRYRAAVARLKRARSQMPFGVSAKVAEELEEILELLRGAEPDPCTGTDEALKFFDTAEPLLARCDDSYGHVGDVYRFAAADLFVRFASQCDDKRRLLKLVIHSWETDRLGLTDGIVERATQFLPEAETRELIAHLLSDPSRPLAYRAALSIAFTLKDVDLYERAAREGARGIEDQHRVALTQLNLANGDAEAARRWIDALPSPHGSAVENLRVQVYRALGDLPRATEIAYEAFHDYPDEITLSGLLTIVGEERRAEIIRSEVELFHRSERYSNRAARFMYSFDLLHELGDYVIRLRADIRPDYATNIEFAKALAPREPLASTVLYRIEIDELLARAESTRYAIAVGYLKKCAGLAEAILDWRDVPNHEAYVALLRSEHPRKSAFWKLQEGGRSPAVRRRRWG